MSTDINPAETIDQAINALPFVRRGHDDRAAYDEAYDTLVEQFKDALYAESGEGLTPAQAEHIYQFAYREGHASGWYDIRNQYIDLADFARTILAS
jgi:hypothetical protein